jgi:hypothetical protein
MRSLKEFYNAHNPFFTILQKFCLSKPGYFTCAKRYFAPITGFPLGSNKAHSRALPSRLQRDYKPSITQHMGFSGTPEK